MAPKKIRQLRTTLLIVAEGHTERAFLLHLKANFSIKAIHVDIVNAKGKGPDHILDHAISCQAYSPRDLACVLLDTDLPWPPAKVKQATDAGFTLIGSTPCIDGILLEILGERKPEKSSDCKKALGKILTGDSTDRDTYTKHMPVELINQMRSRIDTLNKLIQKIQGTEE